MYNAGPDLSFVGLVLYKNCLQRLAVGRLNCGSIFICVFVFVGFFAFNRRVICSIYLHFLFGVVFVFISYAD